MQINNKKDFTLLLTTQVYEATKYITPLLADKLALPAVTTEEIQMVRGSNKHTHINIVRGEEYTPTMYVQVYYEAIIQAEVARYGTPMHQYSIRDMKKLTWSIAMRTVYDIAYELRLIAGYTDAEPYAQKVAKGFVSSKLSKYSNNKQEERV